MTVENTKTPVVLVTGCGRERIGYAIARDLAERGYRVAAHSHRSREGIEKLEQFCRDTGRECQSFTADLTIEQQVSRMFEEVQSHFGRLDVLVVTASVWEQKRLEEIRTEDLLEQFEINALASFLCARAAGLKMAEQKAGGSIILFGDASIDQPYADHAAYFLSKGAMPTLTRTMAVELAARNPQVRVNCIQPGSILFAADASKQEREALKDATLVKKASCPEMVCLTVRFLIENEFLTGACLPLDGGRSLQMRRDIERHQGKYTPGDRS